MEKWYDKKWLVTALCIVFFPVGLYALWKSNTIAKMWKIITTILILGLFFYYVGSGNKNAQTTNQVQQNTVQSNQPTNQSTQTENVQQTPAENVIGIGDILHTPYFDVTVKSIKVSNSVNTGNQFSDLKPEEGNKYIVMKTVFKNTSNESRMITDGTIWINYNGQNYEFDEAETLMLEGWGLLLDQINPLVTKTTNLVYKVPAELKGNAYFQPGRSENDQTIFIGNIE